MPAASGVPAFAIGRRTCLLSYRFSHALPKFRMTRLLVYAVNIHRTPVQPWTGNGIYLWNGLFVTAAHVVGAGWMTRPKVVDRDGVSNA